MLYIAYEHRLNDIVRFAKELWPDSSVDELNKEYKRILADRNSAVFVYFETGAEDIGFAQVSLRKDYVEGTDTSPVGYLEAVYVREPHRHRGIGKYLVLNCEYWAHEHGCTEFASDCELTNEDSRKFHEAIGFSEVNRIICFAKKIRKFEKRKEEG